MAGADKNFSVGEPCFAKVKGYPAWPAEVTSVAGGKFEVFFFGTHEVARLTNKDLFKASEANIAKFSHPKMKTRKWYKEGLEEMLNLLKKIGGKAPVAAKSSKAVAITTPTKIPAIRSKEGSDDPDSTLSPVVLLDSRVVAKADAAKKAASSKLKSGTSSPSKSERQSGTKRPAADLDSSPESDPYKRAVPTVTPSRRQLEKAQKEAEKSPQHAEVLHVPHPPSAKKGSKRQPEPSNSPSKKQKPSEPIKMNINISLEMSPETFLRVARELPGLLSASNSNIGINIEERS